MGKGTKKKTVQLTKEQKAQIKEYFDMFDADKSGVLSGPKEIDGLMHAMGMDLTPKERDEYLEDGDITREEFEEIYMKFYSEQPSDPTDASGLKEAFAVFDTDGNGSISLKELKDIMCRGDDGVSGEEVEVLFNSADINGDGVLSIEEFAEFLKQ